MNKEKQHKTESFRILYEKDAPKLIAFACRFVDFQTAEDIVQDLFLKLWSQPTLLVIEESISSYLYRSVQNACLNYLNHQSVRQQYAGQVLASLKIEELKSFKSLEDLLIEREQMQNIREAIQQLPEKCREIFILYYLNDRKSAEIANELHLSIRTVETQIYKGLKTLQKRLSVLLFYVKWM